jgi:hypothetical protein
MNAEQARLQEAREEVAAWKKWGPYLSERQWGTVREDYSAGGDAWSYFSHDQARSRAYRWGEDGIAGISDQKQFLCFALAMWNGKDPILKERIFGLTNNEGNHGEDVKEYYFYLDSTPTHSYMKYLYKYPQAEFPYANLVDENRRRGKKEFEYELLDTGVFNEDRYFDVFVEYAKASPEDILIEITVANRGPDEATLQLLPTLWFRNLWSWEAEATNDVERPSLREIAGREGAALVEATHERLGKRYFHCEGAAEVLFTENESNLQRLLGQPNPSNFVKDAFHDYVVHGNQAAVNPAKAGTKCAARYVLTVPAGGESKVRLRLTDAAPSEIKGKKTMGAFGKAFEKEFSLRRAQADEFYQSVTPPSLNEDQARVMRQALAGMMWSKQFYFYDLNLWLEERGNAPFKPNRTPAPRNDHWHHLYNADVISMPDKWEYPWYAAWDLAFHVLALTIVDSDFGKEQLELVLREQYMHPNGQIPAYEWNFGDVNPPVHAWATSFTYQIDKMRGQGDIQWLENCFQKLLLNFTWWVNRKDRTGSNLFEGGFLGLDNIGVFDRSAPLPTGGYLEQADGTAWMVFFCQNMLKIATELAENDPTYCDMVLKFSQHSLWIASSMIKNNGEGMWDEEDGFFYDVLRTPDGQSHRLKVRSMVGLLPLCAATYYEESIVQKFPEVIERFRRFLDARPDLLMTIHDVRKPGFNGRRMTSVLNEERLRRVLAKMLDESEFLSPFGIRSLSKFHQQNPYVLNIVGQEYRVDYLPAESDSGMFGGNSNWRGPIWMPVNGLIIRALLQYYGYYGEEFKIECPTGSGKLMTLYQIAEEIANRNANMFLRNEEGKRPVFGGAEKFQNDPHWKDYLQFYEYFHGDNGAGLGASHQTGWTGIVAREMQLFATLSPEQFSGGQGAAVTAEKKTQSKVAKAKGASKVR